MPLSGILVCDRCGLELQAGWRVCPACARPLDDATRTNIGEPAPSSSGVDEGRFPAGTVLAGRYKILGLIGRGGMGEVYRAFDQILNQAVALKFVAAAGELDEAALNRFRNEVRVARQVSHPNVCRVYDIGFVEGTHFLSMEYLDGENLGSLLRRIGRLPPDKATEFARRICAGLAAAHERGVLHRDLKPANIMIDGRGQVRITDFGLAAFAKEISIGDLRSGTPAYMSPEQRAGREVTTRSDIYALGLVLYEMFTGKRRGESQSNPSDLVKDLDPGIERVILRCLEEDPRRRPASPLNVAMALPGGDPVAAALAAGETPSPEMVAASDVQEGFRPRTAALCFAVVVLATLVGFPIARRGTLLGHLPLPIPADGLAFRAQEVLRSLGYAGLPSFAAYGFTCCAQDVLAFAEQQDDMRRDAILASHRPAVATFWYRRSPVPMVATGGFLLLQPPGVVEPGDPPMGQPGELQLQLDPLGRLTSLHIRPSGRGAGNARLPDWGTLFEAAGLDLGRFTTARPASVPPMAIDAQAAWTGTSEDGRAEPMHVEAAAFEGRAVFFEVRSAGLAQPVPASTTTLEGRQQGLPPAAASVLISFSVLILGCLGATTVVAWRNVRMGRSDRRGAAALAALVLISILLGWVVGANHAAAATEVGSLVLALSRAASWAGLAWLFYVAIEPYVRRNWPEALISWNRLNSRGVRDPLVASHLLVGLAAGLVFERVVLNGAHAFLSSRLGLFGVSAQLDGALSSAQIVALPLGLFLGLMLLIFVVLVRLLTRRLWVADVAGALVFSVLGVGLISPLVGPVIMFLTCLAWLWVLRRFGLLPVFVIFSVFPIRWSPSVLDGWLATPSIVLHSIPVAIAAVAMWVILAGRPRPAAAAGH